MPEDNKDITQRLSDHSTKVNVNAMQIALLEQRMTIQERRVDEYHQRLHKAENDLLTMRVVQEIHDTEIKVHDKMLIGNGVRETIPMDLDRLTRTVNGILQVDTKTLQADVADLMNWQEKVSNRGWQIWLFIIGLVISQVWQWVMK